MALPSMTRRGAICQIAALGAAALVPLATASPVGPRFRLAAKQTSAILDFEARPPYRSLVTRLGRIAGSAGEVGAMQRFIGMMDDAGVGLAVTSGESLSMVRGWSVSNEEVAEVAWMHPDRLLGCGTVREVSPHIAQRKIDHCAALGLVGVSLTLTGDTTADLLLAACEAAQHHRIFLKIRVADWKDNRSVSLVRMILPVALDRWRNLRVVICTYGSDGHLAYPEAVNAARLSLRHQVFVLGDFFMRSKHIVKSSGAVGEHCGSPGPVQLLFASRYPLTTLACALQMATADQRVRDRTHTVFSENGRRLLADLYDGRLES